MTSMDPEAFNRAVDSLDLGSLPSPAEVERRAAMSLQRSQDRRAHPRPWTNAAWATAAGLFLAACLIVGLLL